MASGVGSEVVLSIVWYIFAHRLLLLILNLVVGGTLLSLILSIPWFRRHGISFGWFMLLVKEERIPQVSSHGVGRVEIELQSLSSPPRTLSRTSVLHIRPEGRTSFQTNTQPYDPEIYHKSPAQSYAASVVSTAPDVWLSRNSSTASKYSQETTDQSLLRRQRLEPLRRSVGSDIWGAGPVGQDIEEPSLTYAETTTTLPLPPPPPSPPSPPSPPPLPPQSSNSSTSYEADISDMRAPETPTSSATESFGADAPETPRRFRPPTYGSVFSQQSFATLPVYTENDDDRLSIVSRAPTYRSTVTVLSPRSPLRFTRPPLPVPPSSFLSRMVRHTP